MVIVSSILWPHMRAMTFETPILNMLKNIYIKCRGVFGVRWQPASFLGRHTHAKTLETNAKTPVPRPWIPTADRAASPQFGSDLHGVVPLSKLPKPSQQPPTVDEVAQHLKPFLSFSYQKPLFLTQT